MYVAVRVMSSTLKSILITEQKYIVIKPSGKLDELSVGKRLVRNVVTFPPVQRVP